MRRNIGLLLGLFMCGGFFASPVSANTVGVFSTGVDASGNAVPAGTLDLHYVLTANPAGTGATTFTSGYPYGVASTATSAWIGPTTCGRCDFAVGTYLYQTTFSITGLNPSTVQLTGQWAADNNAEILLNGVSTGNSLGAGDFGHFTPFTINSGFVTGVNTLVFDVFNAGGPTGLQVQISGTGTPITTTPEPSSLILLGSGVLGVVAAARRKLLG